MGDRVFDAIADYASKVASRAGLLSIASGPQSAKSMEAYALIGRHLFTIEHSLAVDLGRTTPDVSIHERDRWARASLALAAFWCDRPELLFPPDEAFDSYDPLLGKCPSDAVGAALHDHAETALNHIGIIDATHTVSAPRCDEVLVPEKPVDA